jgi:small subunit ribosomal protein S3
MAFSYLNNNHIKFNNYSCWYTRNRQHYRKFIVIETLTREKIKQKLIYNKEFYLFDINMEIRYKNNNLSVVIAFKYQLSYKKLKSEEINNKVLSWLFLIKKTQNIDDITIKSVISNNGDKSAFCFSQILSKEVYKHISNRKIRMIAKANISNKNLGYIIKLKGRINGNSIARKDKVQRGLISRNTLKYDIDFTSFTCINKSGCVGIKVWINRGLLPTPKQVAKEIINT